MKWQNVLTTFKQCFQQNFQWFMRCVFWSLSGHKEPQCCFLPSVPDASEFQACTEGKISCYWALNFYLVLSCFLLYLIFVSPPLFFLFLGIYYASLLKEKFSWKPGELWNNFTIHNLLFERGKRWAGVEQDSYWNFLFNLACFFFGILSHLFNWIVLICVYMSMERWLIHKLGGKVVYDH